MSKSLNFNDLWDGKDYADNSQIQKMLAGSLLDEYKLTGKETVLDIGCGDGGFTIEIAQSVPQGKVIGIDPSLSMIERAQTRLATLDLPRVSFIQGSAETFQVPEKFDLIFGSFSIHWV